MALDRYREKRDFERTPEPPPKKGRTRNRKRSFVVQKHDARRLHWDFRLEHDGVLLSWAVPKGPSLDPGERRLAVRTEDHPMSYAGFEGTIPEGEYGAGEVVVWDEGTWTPDGDPDAGLAKGHLEFHLEGERLHGGFRLVRTKDRGGKESWLLMKRNDDDAIPGDHDRLVVANPGSVRSGLDTAQLDEDPDLLASVSALPGAVSGAVPWPLTPMLAEPGPPVTGPDWLHEIKWDGYRLLVRVDRGDVDVRTRAGHAWAERLPTIVEAFGELDNLASAVFDGELVWLGADGHADFGRLQRAIGKHDPHLFYLAFDVVSAAGFDLRRVPLRARKALLRRLLPDKGSIRRVDAVDGDAAEVLERMCALGLEGIVSKKADGAYRSERSAEWSKTRCAGHDTFVVGGWCERNGRLASLLLGRVDPDGRLRYVGRVGTGFSDADRSALRARLARLKRKSPPFRERPKDDEGAVWVKPDVLVDVTYAAWTHDGRLRHASFRGLADTPEDTPLPTLPKVTITHPERVLFPDVGVTKKDLIVHYARVAHLLLPGVARRRLSLVRCPEGVAGPCFFQRHLRTLPATVHGTPADDPGEAPIPYIDDVDGLIGLAQHGVIELHPSGARIDRPDRPDRLVFDLDPDESLAWEDVVVAAEDVRDFLSGLGLTSFVRTTGGKGLHVVVPIDRRTGWEDVRTFCREVAETITAREPDRFVAVMTKRRRIGRIFLDHLRNAPSATAVGSWVVRARPNAGVSVPVTWETLRDVPPGGWTVTTLEVPSRDPWAAIGEVRQSLTAKVRAALDREKR